MKFAKLLDEIRDRTGRHEVFHDFCQMATCALSMMRREEEYKEVARKYEKRDLDKIAQAFGELIVEMEARPFEDLLGEVYMDRASKWNRQAGEFYTPQSVCDMMAAVTMGEWKEPGGDKWHIDICDPACGSGRMTLAAARHWKENVRRLRFTMIDVNATACRMAYVNATLWSLNAQIIHANALDLRTPPYDVLRTPFYLGPMHPDPRLEPAAKSPDVGTIRKEAPSQLVESVPFLETPVGQFSQLVLF